MADYVTALGPVQINEGIYDAPVAATATTPAVNETVMGIDRGKFPNDLVWRLVDELKKTLSGPALVAAIQVNTAIRAEVTDFYRRNFWEPIRGDELPWQDVANTLLDMAVNCGILEALLVLQRLLNLGNRNGLDYADLVATPPLVFSNEMLADLKVLVVRRTSAGVLKAYQALHAERYITLCEANPKLEAYFWGWILNRT